MKSLELTGNRYGKLLVESKAESKGGRTYWNCVCDCGNKKVVAGYHLTGGKIQSCGCYRLSQLRNKVTTHGMSKTRIYHTWVHMKQRVTNENNKKYGIYGGRGIKLCSEWKDFQGFYEWAMANGYRENLSIERIDVNGDYCPQNCTWIPLEKQAKNRRSNHYLTWNGETKTITEWGHSLGIKPSVIFTRVDRYGWDAERALTQKVRKSNVRRKERRISYRRKER